MTRTPLLLGADYDAPATLPDSVNLYEPKRHLALARLRRAEAAGEKDVVQLMFWELGLVDLTLAAAEGVSAYGGGEQSAFAAHYHITPETASYGRERATETSDVILKLHYLEYALLQMEPRGRAWIHLQREVLGVYREYVDGCRAAAPGDTEGFAGLHIERALVAVGRLIRRPGIVRGPEAVAWAEWLLGLAADSRSFPTSDPKRVAQQRHRWIADFLAHLTDLPPAASEPALRSRALGLLDEAAAYYQSTPLNDHFEHKVAEVEASLRKHWGETGTHEQLVRRQFDTTVRRAEFHRNTGNGLLTAHFFRDARHIVEKHRQYFTDADVTRLQLAEQKALEHAVEAGEFAEIRVPMEIPKELMDYTCDTTAATMSALLKQVSGSTPNRAELARDAEATNADAPLHGLLSRTVIGRGKVVGESKDEADNLALDVESRAMFLARLLGAAVATTVVNASSAVGLTADDLVAPLVPLRLDDGTLTLILRGCERLIDKDFVSALHILVPRIEDVLRQHLKMLGVDTTDFKRDVGDGNSRTDDATLGSLMRKSLPDGRTVRDHLGGDLWDHVDSVLNSQTGLNLRNEFAHGLARPPHCSPDNAGLVLSLLYLLADVARRGSAGGPVA